MDSKLCAVTSAKNTLTHPCTLYPPDMCSAAFLSQRSEMTGSEWLLELKEREANCSLVTLASLGWCWLLARKYFWFRDLHGSLWLQYCTLCNYS